MQLNSYEFILILLPAALILYFTAGRINVSIQKLIICISGLAGFAYAGAGATAVLAGSIVMNFLMCEMMLETSKLKKIILIGTIALNVLALLVFKYTDFAIYNINVVLGKDIGFLDIALPLGISFFTFQQIAYAVNVYEGKLELKFLDYLAYILYFPKLVMGPIADPVKLTEQMNNPELSRLNPDNIVSGLKMFSFGLFKKMVIADTFAAAVSWGNSNIYDATSLELIIVMLSYTFRIYFDFSGYSDMAIGVSKMFNIDLPQNFNSPYKAISVRDFWDRWHMSLTGFLTGYIYIPLGGSRKGNLRTYINILIVFTVSGIWHGANWTFILWGVIYGILSVLERMTDSKLNKLPTPVKWLVTFTIINVLWLLFNAPSVWAWVYELKTMVLGGDFTLSVDLAGSFRGVEMVFFEDILNLGDNPYMVSGIVWLIAFLTLSLGACLLLKNNHEIANKNNYAYMVIAAVLFAWSFTFLGSESTFIYNYF